MIVLRRLVAFIFKLYRYRDIIWAMANLRAQVDDGWMRDGGAFSMRGERIGVIPPEELIWSKLYVMQHDRCDWTDVWNLFYAIGSDLDWEYLIRRMGDDVPLLADHFLKRVTNVTRGQPTIPSCIPVSI